MVTQCVRKALWYHTVFWVLLGPSRLKMYSHSQIPDLLSPLFLGYLSKGGSCYPGNTSLLPSLWFLAAELHGRSAWRGQCRLHLPVLNTGGKSKIFVSYSPVSGTWTWSDHCTTKMQTFFKSPSMVDNYSERQGSMKARLVTVLCGNV